MPESKALSTEVGVNYTIKEQPKNLKIEIGKFYLMSTGVDIKIVSIRKLDDQIIIYYKYQRDSNSGKISDIWSTTWGQGQMTLETFKAQCLEFGKVNSIDLLYPQDKKKENYFPIEEK